MYMTANGVSDEYLRTPVQEVEVVVVEVVVAG